MPHQQKTVLVSIFTALLVFSAYGVTAYGHFLAGRYDGAEGLVFLGQTALLLILAGIIATVVANILFNIFYAIITQEPKPSFVIDERDRLIEMRGQQISSYITGAGLIAAMIALAVGAHVFWALHMIIYGFALGDVVSNILKLNRYRRGY